jgi:hypothetical protein
LSLFVEAERRRSELAMYVMPKALESAYAAARGKILGKYSPQRRAIGEAAFTAVAMGMVMVSPFLANALRGNDKVLTDPNLQSTYQNDPQHLSGLVRRILYQFIGPN